MCTAFSASVVCSLGLCVVIVSALRALASPGLVRLCLVVFLVYCSATVSDADANAVHVIVALHDILAGHFCVGCLSLFDVAFSCHGCPCVDMWGCFELGV